MFIPGIVAACEDLSFAFREQALIIFVGNSLKCRGIGQGDGWVRLVNKNPAKVKISQAFLEKREVLETKIQQTWLPEWRKMAQGKLFERAIPADTWRLNMVLDGGETCPNAFAQGGTQHG